MNHTGTETQRRHRAVAPSQIQRRDAKAQRRKDRAHCRRLRIRSEKRQPAERLSSARGREPKTRENRIRNAALLIRFSRALDRAYGTTVRPHRIIGYRFSSTFVSCVCSRVVIASETQAEPLCAAHSGRGIGLAGRKRVFGTTARFHGDGGRRPSSTPPSGSRAMLCDVFAPSRLCVELRWAMSWRSLRPCGFLLR